MVENSYKSCSNSRTTGLGKCIIENFSKLLDTEALVKTDKNKYSISLTFKNFWQDKKK